MTRNQAKQEETLEIAILYHTSDIFSRSRTQLCFDKYSWAELKINKNVSQPSLTYIISECSEK